MKVQCPKCQTAYRLPDDRIPAGGGGFKVRCKHCGTVIDVAKPAPGSSDKASSDIKKLPTVEVAASELRPVPPAETSKSDVKPVGEIRWFVAAGGERQGPFTRDQVAERIRAGEYAPETYAWHKGFKGWEKLGDIETFKGEFPSHVQDEQTQMMSLKEVTAISGEGGRIETEPTDVTADDVAPADGETAETREQMVWKRRETSVLFSLEDYKTRRKTGAGPAISADTLVQVKPIEAKATPAAAAVVPKPATPRVGVINLEETEIRRMADVLARRKKQRKVLVIAGASVLGVAIVAAVVVFVVTRPPAPAPAPQAPAPVAAAPAPAPKPAPPVAAPAPAPAPVAAPAPAVPDKAAKGKDAKKNDAKGREEKPRDKGEAPAPAPAPAKPAEEKKAPEDVNAMLANFRKGQTGAPASAAPAAAAAAAAPGENLPDQLSTGVINSVLRKKQGAVESCVRSSGVAAGTTVRAVARLTIAGSGSVSSVSVGSAGDAAGCIEGALKGLSFPRFKGDSQSVTYPFTVSL
jgi:predicted Zn finger-like uncharacterized protein